MKEKTQEKPALPVIKRLSIMIFSKEPGCSFFSFDQTLTKFCLPKVLIYF